MAFRGDPLYKLQVFSRARVKTLNLLQRQVDEDDALCCILTTHYTAA